MDGHGDYSSLERSRLLRSGLDGVPGGGGAGSGINLPTIGEFAARAATPTTLTLAQYHSRFGLPSAMPGSNFAFMGSLLSGAHSPEASKALLIDFQHYWSAHADNFPRYLMTRGLYPSYPPLLPGTAESLSLLGAGVACVAGGASTAAGPSQPHHVTHYQRLLEMQKEAYLASVSAASHHQALYGIGATALPPFLEQAPVSAHPATPLSLVKQEPREVPCTEKVAKQNERRGMGFKVDQDLNRGSRDTFLSSSSLGSVQLKEPKLSPSISAGRSEKKGSSFSTAPGSSNSHHNRSSAHSSANSNSTRQYSDNVRSKCTSPSSRLVPPSSSLISPKNANSSGSKTSLNVSKQTKTSTHGHVPSCGNNSKTSSPSSALFSEPPVISVPTQAAAPIPLATVQHDGVVLSALASPSSAAASSASSKSTILKQQTDKLSRTSNGDKDPADVMKSVLETSTPSCGLSNRQVDGEQCFDRNSSHNKSDGTESRDVSVGNMDSCSVASENKAEDKQLSDDNSDIVVDSTESDDIPTTACSPPVPKSDQDRAVEETIEKVASTVDSLMEADVDCPTSPHCSKNSPDHANSPLVSVTRKEISCIVTSSGSPSGTRTVYAKTASVSAVTVSGCVQLTSTIATQASTSALPYYDTLYCKPEGVRRVHATTFVPEVGIFKGPSTKGLHKIPSSPSPSGTRTLSPESRYKLDPRFTANIFSLPSEGHTRARDSTPSPLLLSPSRDLTSHSTYNASASPGTAHTNTEISSSLDSVSLDSASVRSHSVASFHSAPDADDSDETSDENDNDLVIDDDVQSTQGDYSKSKKCSLQKMDPDTNDNITLKKNGDEICSNVSICAEVELGRRTPIKAVKDNVHIISDAKVNDTSKSNSFITLESKVPCDLSDRMCCDEAIDYSLPKSSFSEVIDHAPNLPCHMSSRTSYPFQSSPTSKLRHSLYNARRHIHNARTVGAKDSVEAPQKTHKSLPKLLPRSCTQCPINTTKIISSPTKPLIRNAIVSSLRGSLTAPGSSHKRLKPNSENATSQGVLSNAARRLMEELGITRCGSAPPATNSSSIKPLKISLFQSQDSLSCRDMEHHDRNDGPSEHNLGNIPVGIAVAQIRPHQIHQSREFRASDNASRDVRLGQVSASTKTITQTTTTMAAPATALAPSLMVAGRTGPWLQQMPFPLHQTMNSSGTTFDPSFPITAPSGFKFAHDSLTGQFFIVPTGEFVEQGGVWPPAGFVAATGLGSTHYQTNVAHPTITIHGPEERDGKSKTENGSGKITETIICVQETISKDRTGLTRGDGKHHPNVVEGGNGSSTQGVITAATAVMVNPMTNISSSSPPPLLKIERPTVESRGCSPIVIEDVSLSLSSKLSSFTSKKISTITVGVQTCDSLMQSGHERNSSPPKIVAHDQAIQISPSELSVFKPLSVQCPDLDSVDSLTNTPEVKTNLERTSYNPFTDPQILQAADGLELLSTLAEKRTKCSSLDDPKRIFPSPSDSFKSDSASIVAIEDTLSPEDVDFKSGQCTLRREVRRDLSPKWSLSKKEKEPQTLSVFADFKAPPDVEILEDSEVRVKLAEVQRQYKEKQKELAKLQNKRNEDSKKRGPGRPPKKKIHSKKSDEDSSSCSSKTKEHHHHHHHQHKKKRPAEELVDRVFRKLPPLIKPGKVSRSIHYVKSKTGPFFRRKSASSSVKRNKDLFGFDERNWPSFSERKHQEKVKNAIKAFSGKSKSKHRTSSNQSEDSKYSHDAGNIFANLESFGGDYRRELLQKHHSSHKHGKSLSTSGTVCIKTEPCSTAHQESGLGLLAKFALTVTTSSLSTCSVSLPLTSTSSISTASSSNQSSVNSFSTGTFSSSSIYCTSLYNTCSSMYNMSGTNSGRSAPNLTFGSLSSIMSSAGSGLMSFNNPNLTYTSVTNNSTIMTSASVFTTTPLVSTTSASAAMSPITSAVTVSITHAAPLFPSPGAYQSSTEESSSGASSSSSGSTNFSSSSCATSSSGAVRDISPVKHKHEDDSDTDTSDTSPNKKRKPGRPRKINPEKSSGGTETIWAKKSSTIGLLQVTDPNSSQAKEGSIRKLDQNAMKPLFLDEEWTRRRSERIFLNEPSPLPSPAITPPRESWKLANFMPKSKKVLDASKSTTEDKGNADTIKEKSPTVNLGPAKSSSFSVLSLSSSVTIKSEGKELTSLILTPAKPVPCKNTEISVPRAEDAKMIVRLEDSTTKLPFLLSSSLKSSSLMSSSPSPEKIRKICKKNGPFKDKKLIPLSVISSSSLSPPPPTLEKKEKRAKEHSKIKFQKAKSLHDLTQRVKKKYSKAVIRKQSYEQSKKDSSHCKKKRKISTDSSDNDNLPLVLYRDGPPTPEPRSCKLQLSDLREGLKVLYLIDGLFHEGTVKALQPPDVYGVLTAGQRGNRPHILCLEEILKWAVLDVHPRSICYLPEGTRVCAFWSQQFSCLYPGTVSKSSPANNGKKVVVPVEFDDGDNGRIELDHIRLLPADFPIVEYEPDPLEVLPKRKQRTASDASDLRKSMDAEPNRSKHKDDDDGDEEDDDEDDDEEEVEEDEGDEDDDSDDGYIKDDEDSDVSDTMVKHKPWRWEGKCTKRPGLKGKAKKTFYKAISRDKEVIKIGDSAVFVSRDRANCPYIGRIESLWQGWNGQMMVKVHWYYHPEETQSEKKLSDPRNALFESQHEDENDIQTIAYKCEVLPLAQYKKQLNKATKKGQSLKSSVFYVAGFYEPTAKQIIFYPGVS